MTETVRVLADFGWTYYNWPDLVATAIVTILIGIAAVVVYRMWRTANRIAEEQAKATNRLATALKQVALAVHRTTVKVHAVEKKPDAAEAKETSA